MPNQEARSRIRMLGAESLCGYSGDVAVLAKAGSRKFTLVHENGDRWRIDRHYRVRGMHHEEEARRLDCPDDVMALARFIDFLREEGVTYSVIILFYP